MKLYVARDKNNGLHLYAGDNPQKDIERGEWCPVNANFCTLESVMFPDVRWSDEVPTEVEIVIKR